MTIAPLALIAAAIGVLLALRLVGAGFDGDPLAVVANAAPDDRLWEVGDRRGPVLGVTLLAWLTVFGAAMAVSRERAGRFAARLIALSLAYLPLVCLLGAALEPSIGAERLLAMLGTPLLAALTLTVFGGYRALAVACAASVFAYSVDVIVGSPLTRLSLVGPNPVAGHRYYGIGNELEAILVVLTLVGTGAALTSLYVREPVQTAQRRLEARGPAAFLVVAAVLSFVFAYGRYGADVGAAIVLPLGGAVAAALLAGRPRLALAAFALPIPALAILAAADFFSGADAHLTSAVLQADSSGDAFAVFGDRLREAGESFGRPLLLPALPVVLAAAVVSWVKRRRIAVWLRGRDAMRAGLAGALAATLVGTLANDSGALLLELGAAYLLAFLAFAWAESERPVAARDIDYA